MAFGKRLALSCPFGQLPVCCKLAGFKVRHFGTADWQLCGVIGMHSVSEEIFCTAEEVSESSCAVCKHTCQWPHHRTGFLEEGRPLLSD